MQSGGRRNVPTSPTKPFTFTITAEAVGKLHECGLKGSTLFPTILACKTQLLWLTHLLWQSLRLLSLQWFTASQGQRGGRVAPHGWRTTDNYLRQRSIPPRMPDAFFFFFNGRKTYFTDYHSMSMNDFEFVIKLSDVCYYVSLQILVFAKKKKRKERNIKKNFTVVIQCYLQWSSIHFLSPAHEAGKLQHET